MTDNTVYGQAGIDDAGIYLYSGSNRNKKTLGEFFATLIREQKGGLEAVAMDMWESFINRVKHHCPQLRIVFNFLHVVRGFGNEIDQVRRGEYRKATEEEQKVLNGRKALWPPCADY
ncbi:MAG: transposase [Planctomycetes bacterium]|nr:transposase [Planctomycetota bacterium]